jgi:hypothetical protein
MGTGCECRAKGPSRHSCARNWTPCPHLHNTDPVMAAPRLRARTQQRQCVLSHRSAKRLFEKIDGVATEDAVLACAHTHRRSRGSRLAETQLCSGHPVPAARDGVRPQEALRPPDDRHQFLVHLPAVQAGRPYPRRTVPPVLQYDGRVRFPPKHTHTPPRAHTLQTAGRIFRHGKATRGFRVQSPGFPLASDVPMLTRWGPLGRFPNW